MQQCSPLNGQMHKWQLDLLDKMAKFKGRGLLQITGRNVGKGLLYNQWLNYMTREIHKKEIFWVDTARRLTLAARVRKTPEGWDLGISEQDIMPIVEWCHEHNCGVRTSFDMIKFRNKKEMTMFLLRWG